MTSRTYSFRTIFEKLLEQNQHYRPSEGVVHSIDGETLSITLGKFGSIIRGVKVVGDIGSITVGQTVYLLWDKDRPVAMVGGSGGSTERAVASVIVDGNTIERSYEGLRVKRGGIGKEHLNFAAADADHTHFNALTHAGWFVSDAGVFYNRSTRLYPDGDIVLGDGDEAIFLSSTDDTYRFWAGASLGELAPFSIDKLGNVEANAGHIGGWQIGKDSIFSDVGNAEINAKTPFIRLGAQSYTSGTGFWVGKYGSVYRMRIGSSSQYLKWDGTNLTITGTISATTGHIGGWTVTQYAIESDSGNAKIRSDLPAIELGAASYSTGSGFWVGKDSGAYKLRIGSTSEFLRWNGTALEVSGTFRLGNPPPTANNAGTGIFMDNTGFYGLNKGFQQIFIDTLNGRLSAGGNVYLDENGISIGPQLILNRSTSDAVIVELQFHRPDIDFSIFWDGVVAALSKPVSIWGSLTVASSILLGPGNGTLEADSNLYLNSHVNNQVFINNNPAASVVYSASEPTNLKTGMIWVELT